MPVDLKVMNARLQGLMITLVVIAILYIGRDILIPIALAILLSFVLSPLVRIVEMTRIGRVASVLTVLTVCSLLLVVGMWSFGSQLVELGHNLPAYKTNLLGRIQDVKDMTPSGLQDAQEALAEVVGDQQPTKQDVVVGPNSATSVSVTEVETGKPQTRSKKTGFLERFFPDSSKQNTDDQQTVRIAVVRDQVNSVGQVMGFINPILGPLGTMGIVIVLTIFVLLDREDFRNRLLQLFGSSNLAIATKAMTEATGRSTDWLRTMVIINAMYGAALTAGLLMIGLPSALLWGTLGFFCRFLPYVGPWIGAIIPIALSFGVFEGWANPLLIIALYIVLELIVNMVLEPMLYGRSLGLTSIGIILAAIFWTTIWGPIGLLVAVPVTMWLVVLGHHIPQMSQFTLLFGDLSEMPSYHSLYQRLLAFDQTEADLILDRHFNEGSSENILEKVLMPLFTRLKLDQKTGFIDADQVEFVFRTIGEHIEELADEAERDSFGPDDSNYPAGQSENSPAEPLKITLFPAGNESEAIVAEVLRMMFLRQIDCSVDLSGTELLASEVVERIASDQQDVVVLCAVSLVGQAKIRSICKKLSKIKIGSPVLILQQKYGPTRDTPKHGNIVEFSSTEKLLEALKETRPSPLRIKAV